MKLNDLLNNFVVARARLKRIHHQQARGINVVSVPTARIKGKALVINH